MKLIKALNIALLALRSIIFCSDEKRKKTDLDLMGLKGKVRSIEIRRYLMISNRKIQSSIKFIIFSSNENKIIEKLCDPNGSLIDKAIYQYDSKNNTTKITHYNSNGDLYYTCLYQYNNQGNKIEETHPDDKWVYKHDDNGNEIEWIGYNSDGSLEIKRTYQYDDRGNQVEETDYKLDGSLNYKMIYQYDDRGNQVEHTEYNADGSLVTRGTFRYDDRDNIIESRNWYNTDGSLETKLTYQYEYDKHGNWIKKVEFDSLETCKITEREIEYYD